MSAHAFSQPARDDQGRAFVSCACGARLRAASLNALAQLIGEHLLGLEDEERA